MRPLPMAPVVPPEPLDVDEMLVAYAEEVALLKARVAALELELDEARDEIDVLECEAESSR